MDTPAPDAAFLACLRSVLAHEGGFVQHPLDPGGATNFGITRRTLSRARGHMASDEDVRRLGAQEAAEIYRRFYWAPIRADAMPAGVALALFDFAVNSGPARAARLFQTLLGVEPDGLMGPRTLAAIARHDPAGLVRGLTRARLDFLARLVIWPVFGRGWRRRVLSVEQDALRLVLADSSPERISAMTNPKSILSSRTIWSNAIGLGAILLGLFGFDAASLDTPALADAVVQVIAAGSFIASTAFRVLATRPIAK